ncbi:MAG TPA: SEC-C metal-binding domain-containing protein, partial [Burkholderiales bacterium]|nr:SEC-C metal-binding domain-containing protein [Burkholderiales bacterium]
MHQRRLSRKILAKDEAMKIGRNDPCPCGSGKKYKQCCFAAEANPPSAPDDLRWRRMRRLLDDHPRDMLRFVESAYGPSAIKEALQEFTLWAEEDVFELDPCHTQVFMPWFFHHWSPDPEVTEVEDQSLHSVSPTVTYLRSKRRRLDPMLVRYLEACVAAPFSFFEALRVDPGRGVRLRDILIGEEHEVIEHSASIAMRPGDIIFGQVAEVDGMALLEACSGALIPPVHKGAIIELRKHIAAGGDLFGRELLHEWDAELLELYHNLTKQVFNPKPPRLQNTDGDPLSLQKLVFDVDSAQQAFDALKHLALDQSDDELLEGAERDAEGKLLR